MGKENEILLMISTYLDFSLCSTCHVNFDCNTAGDEICFVIELFRKSFFFWLYYFADCEIELTDKKNVHGIKLSECFCPAFDIFKLFPSLNFVDVVHVTNVNKIFVSIINNFSFFYQLIFQS